MSKLKFKIGDVVILKSDDKKFDGKEYFIHHFQGDNPKHHPYFLVPIEFKNSSELLQLGSRCYGADESDITLSLIYNTPLQKALNEL